MIECIYDLAWCSPDCGYSGDVLSARIFKYSGLMISAEECQRQADGWWERIHAAPSVTIKLATD